MKVDYNIKHTDKAAQLVKIHGSKQKAFKAVQIAIANNNWSRQFEMNYYLDLAQILNN